jgi:hypothetical protein
VDIKHVERFNSRIKKDDNDCWIWTGVITKEGCGQFGIGKKNFLAHRISYVLKNGEIGTHDAIVHTCPNKSCVNPDHLKIKKLYKHNNTNLKTYRAWNSLRNRCTNPNDPFYRDYGGRGIDVCEEWLISFESFFNDMGNPPTKTHSIDRINNDLGYFKENCRWADKTTQAINQRKKKKKSSYPTGVSKVGNRFMSRISIQKTKYTLGYFETPEKAKEEYNKIFNEWYGYMPNR